MDVSSGSHRRQAVLRWVLVAVCAGALAVTLVAIGYQLGAQNDAVAAAPLPVAVPQTTPAAASGGQQTAAAGAEEQENEPEARPRDEPRDGGEALAPLAELYDELTRRAVDPPNRRKLLEQAGEAMVEALGDPYAEYFDRREYQQFNRFLDGTFSGVGMVLEEKPDGLVVVSVFEDTPAARAGVQQGERIVEVNGRDVTDESIEQVVNRIKGKAGTTVTVGLRGGSAGERTLRMKRRQIDLPSIGQRMLDSGVGYVSLFQFADDAGADVRQAVEELRTEGANGVVLDLRGNPGGLLNEAVDVASVFLEEGTEVVSVQERRGERETLEATGQGLTDLGLVVLVDEGSASASEIVAGAIQDAGRAPIVGEQTFGKGTVQTIQPLAGGSGAKFTTARYYTPSGDSIEKVGVTPDRKVTDPDAQLQRAEQILGAGSAG